VGAAIDARRARAVRNAQLRKFRFPRAQHVRLQLREVAHLGSLEERAFRDVNRIGDFRHGMEKYISDLSKGGSHVPEWPKPCPPRPVAGSASTSSQVTLTTGATTSWAMRMPRDTRNVSRPRLING